MKVRLILLCLIMLISISIVSAQNCVGVTDDEVILDNDESPYNQLCYDVKTKSSQQVALRPKTKITATTNSSDFWDDYDTPFDFLWTTAFNDTGDGRWSGGGDNASWNESYADTRYAQYQFTNNNFNGSGNFTTDRGGIYIDSEYTTNTVLNISAGKLTTGSALSIISNSFQLHGRDLVFIRNANNNGNNVTALKIENIGEADTSRGLFIESEYNPLTSINTRDGSRTQVGHFGGDKSNPAINDSIFINFSMNTGEGETGVGEMGVFLRDPDTNSQETEFVFNVLKSGLMREILRMGFVSATEGFFEINREKLDMTMILNGNLNITGEIFSTSPVKINESIIIKSADSNMSINSTHLSSTNGRLITENITANSVVLDSIYVNTTGQPSNVEGLHIDTDTEVALYVKHNVSNGNAILINSDSHNSSIFSMYGNNLNTASLMSLISNSDEDSEDRDLFYIEDTHADSSAVVMKIVKTGTINGGGLEIESGIDPLKVIQTEDDNNIKVGDFRGERNTPADNDNSYFNFQMQHDGDDNIEIGTLNWKITDVSEDTEDGIIWFQSVKNNSLFNLLSLGFDLDGNGEVVINEDSEDVNFRVEADGDENLIFADGGTERVCIKCNNPTYTFEVADDESDISIWASKNVSATGYITRTSVFDENKGNPFDYIKSSSYYLDKGVINHSKFYGYAGEFNITDYNRPINVTKEREICESQRGDNERNCYVEEYVVTEYPYKTTEEGVLLDAELNVLREAVYNLNERVKYLEENCVLK